MGLAVARLDLARIAVLGIFCLLPFAVDPQGWNRFGPAKVVVGTACVSIGLGAVLLGRRARGTRSIAIAWLVLLVVAAVSTLAAPDVLMSLLGEGSRNYGLLTLFLSSGAFILGSSSNVTPRAVARALCIGAMPVIGVGLAEMAGLDPFGTPSIVDTTRARSTFGNAAYLGGYLSVLLPCALCLASDRRETRVWRVTAATVSFAGTVLLVGTGTRGAWLAAAAGVTIVVWALRAHTDATSSRRLPRAMAAAAAAIVVVGALGGGLVSNHARADPRSEDAGPDTVAGRIDTWRVTGRLIAERPVTGWGLEGFRIGFPTVVDRGWVRDYGLDRIQDRAHNLFLDMAVATGVPGALALVALLAVTILSVRRAQRSHDLPTIALGAGAAAYLIHTQVFFDTFDGSLLVWMLVGVSTATLSRPVSIPRGVRIAGVGLLGLCLLVAGSTLAADRNAAEAARADEPSEGVKRMLVANRLRPRTAIYAIAAAEIAKRGDQRTLYAARSANPPWRDPNVTLALATLQKTIGERTRDVDDLEHAVSGLNAALRWHPQAGSGWLSLGDTYELLGRRGDARAAYRVAVQLLPRSAAPLERLARLELAVDRTGRVRRLIGRIRAVDPRHPALQTLEYRLLSIDVQRD